MHPIENVIDHTRCSLAPVGPGLPPPNRIGPNAITRMAEALIALDNKTGALTVFQKAGLERYLETPPTAPVPEAEVSALLQATQTTLGARRTRTAAWIAGHRTAEYLLEHRVPKLARQLLQALPAQLASRLLCSLMANHSWTFAGSAEVSFVAGNPTRIVIAGCPLCRGLDADQAACTYYAASFEKLFSTLVHSRARATETQCQALGDAACVFTVDWSQSLSKLS